MRHKKMDEPWFKASSAVPKYVREHKGSLYSDEDDNFAVGAFAGGTGGLGGGGGGA